MDNSSSNSCSSSWDLEIMGMGGNPFHLDPHRATLDFLQQHPPAALHQPSSLHPATAAARVELGGEEEEEKGEEEGEEEEEEEEEALGAMKEMMYRIAAMQPVDIDPASIKKPRRRNVRISEEPQSVAARLRRERISERMRILQRLVPGGTKMDTASMLDEAIRYVKFLKRQVLQLQAASGPPLPLSLPPPPPPPQQPLPSSFLHARASSSLSRFGAFHDHHHHHPML